MGRLLLLAVSLAWVSTAWASDAGLVAILAEELERNFAVLGKKADPPAYYIAYAVTEQDTYLVSASRGSLRNTTPRRNRRLDVTVRVGSPKLDSYHVIRGQGARFTSGIEIPLEDNAAAIRRKLWQETDRVYRLGAQRLINMQRSEDLRLANDQAAADFSPHEPSRADVPPPPLKISGQEWASRIRRLSERYKQYPLILSSSVSLLAISETKYFADSEGARLRHGRQYARVFTRARAKAADGMDLATSENFDASSLERLPPEPKLAEGVDRTARDLMALVTAPVVEPYVGPAILSGRAAGVFFHEIFGHRVEGHRQKDETEGQTFARSVGAAVLPDFVSVVFDATLKSAGGQDLSGWYHFDDEGVPARKVNVVEQGILKTFLMSRNPIPGIDRSNGHGRRQPGQEVVSRQSNLLVESSRAVPEARLREMLVEALKTQGKPFGYYFADITGGFTTTDRRGIQAFKVIPVVVYRVFADGRPDELVRGADLVGTPLASFAKIVAAGDRVEVFNGYCGAESGQVPVSAASPALLISEIEIQKAESSRDRPPLLSAPPATGGSR